MPDNLLYYGDNLDGVREGQGQTRAQAFENKDLSLATLSLVLLTEAGNR